MKWVVRIALAVVALGVLGLVGLGILLAVLHEPLPAGTPGPDADALATRMVEAVDGEAWNQTGAVAWNFGGRRAHLWDRTRQFDRFESGDLVVLIDLQTQGGVASRAGEPLAGAALDQALADAWAAWCNDAYWLNPVVKVFDEGTTRSTVTLDDGRTGLLVTYSSGGVTPGDSYLWIPGDDGLPQAWKMWVSIIPFGGVDASWDGWTILPTGAKVSTVHAMEIGLTLQIEDLRAGATLADIEEGDPFAPLAGR